MTKLEEIKAIEASFNVEGITSEEVSKGLDRIRELEKGIHWELEPLYDVTDEMMVTKFSLILYDEMRSIEDKCKKFYTEHFDENGMFHLHPYNISNLTQDLDYIFSIGLRMTKLIELVGFKDDDTTSHFNTMYLRYQDEGYKAIVGYYVHEYNKYEDRPYTPTELKDRDEKMNKIASDVVDEILADEKKK